MKTPLLTPWHWLAASRQLALVTALNLFAALAGAEPLAYEPFNYNPGEFLAPSPSRTTPFGYWIAQASGANDAIIAAGNLAVPGLMAPSGRCFTNGGAGQGNRCVLNTSITNGAVYASYAMRIDNLGTGFIGTGQTVPTFITSICFSNVQGTLIQYCCLQVNTNGGDQSSFLLGIRQSSGQAYDTWSAALYPVGQTLFIVHGYTFVDGGGNDVCEIWINPDPATFGSNAPPAATLTAFQPSGLTDAYWIDRINFRQASAPSIPAAMTFDELRVGTNWADVTPPPPAAQPRLTITPAPPNAVLSWPTNASGFALQANTNLATTDWAAVTNEVIVDGTNNTVTVDLTWETRFFRLLK
jgi:hypothetical protein